LCVLKIFKKLNFLSSYFLIRLISLNTPILIWFLNIFLIWFDITVNIKLKKRNKYYLYHATVKIYRKCSLLCIKIYYDYVLKYIFSIFRNNWRIRNFYLNNKKLNFTKVMLVFSIIQCDWYSSIKIKSATPLMWSPLV